MPYLIFAAMAVVFLPLVLWRRRDEPDLTDNVAMARVQMARSRELLQAGASGGRAAGLAVAYVRSCIILEVDPLPLLLSVGLSDAAVDDAMSMGRHIAAPRCGQARAHTLPTSKMATTTRRHVA